ncbi:phytanoyl-CoA dioxygenase family protein [Sphaerisporangium rufum]|uniref:phytanoyl-CoA dioxygenase family protein n=1 Tax=Sphaerisporangium rufum TaxID=1381558 RepID=UPI00195178F2|nr:phytanoyl-CoA dioxygenase family protein [Sphaerisporangium rufum]
MAEIDGAAFVRDGFVKVAATVAPELAEKALAQAWAQLGGRTPDDPSGWDEPVMWASDLTGQGPMGEMARSPRLARALDEVCGARGRAPRGALGMIPVRFPGKAVVDDRGWHIDANVALPDGTYAVSGRPEMMLVLTLLSRVGPEDAPTRIRVGSHRAAGAALAGQVLDPMKAGPVVDQATQDCPVAYATGEPGDVFLVHPFTVHAADEHRGTRPRFMAQGPVLLAQPVTPDAGNLLGQALAG